MKKILANVMMVMILSVSIVSFSGVISNTTVEAASWKTVDKKFYTSNISGELYYNDGKSSGILYLVASPKWQYAGQYWTATYRGLVYAW
ncbi:hypothetical protein [Listeria newyorkensis]|uniref:hypothetical protein n=1 Tax=Listeria newyorkensis TaxID=1497681 RepID=UPI00051CCD8F|nr:hypothetical protein [Listeria newyorkensis]KGL43569.1 hypothetical protein EP58_07465 [Listeria newyorkensis]